MPIRGHKTRADDKFLLLLGSQLRQQRDCHSVAAGPELLLFFFSPSQFLVCWGMRVVDKKLLKGGEVTKAVQGHVHERVMANEDN